MNLRIRWRTALLAICLTGSWGAFAAEPAGAPEDMMPVVPGWQAVIDDLEVLPARLLAQLPAAMRDDPLIRQEVARLALQAFTASAIKRQDDCAAISQSITPGTIGLPTKCPCKNRL